MTAFFQNIDAGIPVVDPGTLTAWAAITVDESGRTATATHAIETRRPDGTFDFAAGPMGRTLTRLDVVPLAGLGELAGDTPTP